MITIHIWQILLAVSAAACVGFLGGVATLLLLAAAGYRGDEERSQEE